METNHIEAESVIRPRNVSIFFAYLMQKIFQIQHFSTYINCLTLFIYKSTQTTSPYLQSFSFNYLSITFTHQFFKSHSNPPTSMRDNERRQNRGGDRRGGRFGDRNRNGSKDQGSFRKGSGDFNNRRGGDRDGDDRRNKRISKNNQGRGTRDHKRPEDRKPKDLDGELMNYWIKSGKQDPEGKNVAQQKLNEDMDNYWKQRGAEEKVEQKPEPQ